jgi:hypothetical protein
MRKEQKHEESLKLKKSASSRMQPGNSADEEEADTGQPVESPDRLLVAETMLSMVGTGEETRKQKNRLAARKSREKKVEYLQGLQDKLYYLTKANAELLAKVDKATHIIEIILEEVDQSLTNNYMDLRFIAETILLGEELLYRNAKHYYILQRIKSRFSQQRNNENIPPKNH